MNCLTDLINGLNHGKLSRDELEHSRLGALITEIV